MKKDKIRAELVSFWVESDFSGTAEKLFYLRSSLKSEIK